MSISNIWHYFQIIASTIFAAKAAGHFGLDIYHPDITFHLIISKHSTRTEIFPFSSRALFLCGDRKRIQSFSSKRPQYSCGSPFLILFLFFFIDHPSQEIWLTYQRVDTLIKSSENSIWSMFHKLTQLSDFFYFFHR